MSDSETAMAVAAAIAALRDDDEEVSSDAPATNNVDAAATQQTNGEDEGGSGGDGSKPEAMEEEVVEKPKPKTKVLSCLICTKAVTPENTGLGRSNPRVEYERVMNVVCKLLCVDSHPMLKRYQFRHSDEPKQLCCDECCEVVFNLGSLQSIIDRTKVAINKKLDWILKTVADSAAEESDEIEKTFFSPKSDVFRAEVLQVYERKKNAKNGIHEDSDDEEEMINRGVQTDVSGESGVSNDLHTTKAGLKFYDRPSFSFDDNNMDTYSDHNDDMNFGSTNNDDDSYSIGSNSKSETKRSTKKSTSSYSSYSNSKPTPAKRGRASGGNKRNAMKLDDSDDDIEVLEEKKAPGGGKKAGRPTKSPKVDARELLKVEYNTETGRPKRSAASKRPNYQMLAGDDDDDVPYSKRASMESSRGKKPIPTPRKEVSLSAIPIVKDASGKTYFEGVEIVRTDKSITCKHLGCYYVVDGSGYNAFERIKSHIHETHIGDGGLGDIY